MRVALLSDIHGNLSALDAVLADVEAAVGAMRTLGGPVQEQLLALLIDPLDSDTATAEFERLRGA